MERLSPLAGKRVMVTGGAGFLGTRGSRRGVVLRGRKSASAMR